MNPNASVDSLPNVPGFTINRIAAPANGRHSKLQGFKMVHGVPMENIKPTRAPNRSASAMSGSTSQSSLWMSKPGMRSSDSIGNFTGPSKAKTANWVDKAGQVLCFNVYFKEAVHERNAENFRVRKAIMYYYLEDDTLQVNEPRQENSGIPQGNFIKRHQVPTPGGDANYTLEDIWIGGSITIYGRVFQIIGCNPSTAQYLEESCGRGAQENLGYPDDLYESARNDIMLRETGADFTVSRNVAKNPMKKFMEATLGNTVNNKGLSGFLNYDRMVLRFTCVWDDTTAMFGDKNHFKLHYFVANDTVEVLDVPSPNNGRDPFPLLLKRAPLPKGWKTEDANGRADESPPSEFYHWSDLAIGGFVAVYGRKLILTDADSNTREFFKQNGSALGSPLRLFDDSKPAAAAPPVADFNGWGTMKDSEANCKALVPKAPKTEFDIMGPRLPKTILRFSSKLSNTHPDDQDRRFVIAYYVADSTLQVREPPQRNSGIIGGSMLAKAHYINPSTGVDFAQSDFFIGANLNIAGRDFTILDVDQYTLKYMEGHPGDYPLSNTKEILNALRQKLASEARTGGLTRVFRKYDTDHSGKITIDEFARVMRFYDPDFPDQAVVTLMRLFDRTGDGTITVDEFIQVLEEDTVNVDHAHTDESYKQQAQALQNDEKSQLKSDSVLAMFADDYMAKGSFSELNRKLDVAGKGWITREQFVNSITAAQDANDSTTPNINLSMGNAQIVADYFFKDTDTLQINAISQLVSNLNLTMGQRGHIAREGDGWKEQRDDLC